MKTGPGLVGWLAFAGVLVAVDQATKAWVRAVLAPGDSILVTGFFDLVHFLNTGAAFSFLAGAGGWQRWFFLVLAVLISGWIFSMLRRHAGERLLPFSLSLILAGAIGNVIDRIVLGAVTDFLHFHLGPYYWPAFNVADSCISSGVVLMLWQQFKSKDAADDRTSTNR